MTLLDLVTIGSLDTAALFVSSPEQVRQAQVSARLQAIKAMEHAASPLNYR